MKQIITEEEFDKLAVQTQIYYLYCPVCQYYYLSERRRYHLCGNLKQSDVDAVVKQQLNRI